VYEALFQPKFCSQKCNVIPFFSPDNSLEAYMQVISEAKENIMIANPSKTDILSYY
jgi:hypothetical protein